MKKKFCTIYDHAVVSSPCGSKSRTQQQYKDDCDIDVIMKRCKLGIVPVQRSGVSGDFSNIGDYQACLDKVNKAKDEFLALPSDLRSRFGNDPAAYVDFVLDPRNVDECIRLGLMQEIKKEDTELDVLKRIESNVTPKEEKQA